MRKIFDILIFYCGIIYKIEERINLFIKCILIEKEINDELYVLINIIFY